MQTKPRSPKNATKPEPSVVSGGSNPTGVIYIDQDSDITSIVSKIRQEPAKSIKLVVPKNSVALKSGVNLKLIKRTAHTKIKDLSLVTSDSKLIAMAGVAKIATAPNLSAEPSIATSVAPASSIKVNDLNTEDESPDQAEDLEEDLTIDGSELEDSSVGADEAAVAAASTKSLKKDKADKAKKVPNFYGFRKKALIGLGVFFGVLILLLLAMTSRKSAVIEVQANAERLEVNYAAKLNESAKETTKDELKVVKKSGSKSVTETTPATGQQDIGAKASGKLTITNCTDNDISISAGTGVSSGGQTYLTASTVAVPASDFYSNGTCKNNGYASVNVTAKEAGDQYNSSARSYVIAGVSPKVTGKGGDMTGGTSQIVKVVSDADVATLKDKLSKTNEDAYKQELKSQFNSSQQPLEDTFTVALGKVQLTPAVGQQADQLSGTVTVDYSMFGVEKDELKKILELNINEGKKDATQGIVKNGLEDLKITPGDKGHFNFSTVAYLGPTIDQDLIKSKVEGKKKGEAIQFIKSMEGVDDAKVKIKPFWSSSLPGAGKIEVKMNIADSSKSS